MENSKNHNQRFIRWIVFGCVVTLIAIIALSVGAFMVMSKNIEHQHANSNLVSLSAHMRLLTQRIAVSALSAATSSDIGVRQRALDEIQPRSEELRKNFSLLIKSPQDTSLSSAIRKYYFEEPYTLNKRLLDFVQESQLLLAEFSQGSGVESKHARSLVSASAGLLKDLGELTTQYGKEGEDGILRLRNIQWWILLATCVVTLVIGFFIFQPMVSLLRKELASRSATEHRLRELTETLQNSKDRLLNANKELDVFAGSIAQDLRRPLTDVREFSSELCKMSASLPSSVGESVLKLDQTVSGIDQMLTDLLLLSRVDSAQQTMTMVDLNIAVDEALFEMRNSFSLSKTEANRGDLPSLKGDIGQLRTLFHTLFRHALDLRDGALTVRIEVLPSGANSVDAAFDIKIDGVQADAFFSSVELGSGASLGSNLKLAICKKIVGRHSGSLTLKKESSNSGTISISIPKEIGSKI